MVKYNGLPIYDIKLGKHNVGIKATSLVSVPATDSNFLHFQKETVEDDDEAIKVDFVFASEEKREVVGAIMVPNKPIYRNVNGNRFYVNFSKEVIVELTTKMLSEGTAGFFTIQHNGKVLDSGVEVMEVWNKESETDKSVAFGIEEPIGTTFMKAKVSDDLVWSHVKEHGLNGFSIELDAMIEPLKSNFKKEEKNMLKEAFKSSLKANGVELYFNGELKKSTAIFIEEDGSPVAFDGEFMNNDVKYTVNQGLVTDVENVQVSIDAKFKRLEEGFEKISENIKEILKSDEKLEQEKAELELQKEQYKKDLENFAKQKENRNDISISFEKQRIEDANSLKEWYSKFTKNNE